MEFSSSMVFMVLALSILYSATNISADAPKPCCTPSVFTTGLSLETLTGTTVTSQEGPYYYDGINNRTAANVTVTTSTSESVVQQIYQILDYGKHTQFVIVDDKICYKISLPGPFPDNGCIPDNAQFKGTVVFGESLSVNRWYIEANLNDQKVSQDIAMTDKCVPVTSSICVQSTATSLTAQDYYNFKEGIQNPDQIFTPPKICDKASELHSTFKISDEVSKMLKTPFLL